MMGVAWGTGGMLIPFIGLLADRVGIEATLMAMALVPLAGVALRMAVARARRRRRPGPGPRNEPSSRVIGAVAES